MISDSFEKGFNPPADKRLSEQQEECRMINDRRDKRRFSKRLAYDIAKARGKSKPDITGALVAETMASWQHGSYKEIDGMPVGWMSAAGIQAKTGKHKGHKGLPWLSVKAISNAIARLEKAFPKDVKILRKGKTSVLNFSLSASFLKKYIDSEGEHLLFTQENAMQVGVLKAILIGNLEHRTSAVFKRAPKDAQGRVYSSISASILTEAPEVKGELPTLPYSRQEVAKAISELKKLGVFQKHPEREGVYRVNMAVFGLSANYLVCQQTTKLCQQTTQFEPIDNNRYNDRVKVSVLAESSLRSDSSLFPDSQKEESVDKAGAGYALPALDCETALRATPSLVSEEAIDTAIDMLDSWLIDQAVVFQQPSRVQAKNDLAAFRQLFHKYPCLLDVKLLQGVFDHLGGGFLDEPAAAPSKGKYVHNPYYWAERIKTLGQLVRYFHQLWAEAYAPYDEEPEFYNGKPQRDWYDITGRDGTIPEAHRTILAEYIAEDEANSHRSVERVEEARRARIEAIAGFLAEPHDISPTLQDYHDFEGIPQQHDETRWTLQEYQDYEEQPDDGDLLFGELACVA